MKKPKSPAVAAKKPGYAPIDLKKLELGDIRKNAHFTGLPATSKSTTPRRNTIVGTDNRMDHDIDIDHVNHVDHDIDLDSVGPTTGTGDSGFNGPRLANARSAGSHDGNSAYDGNADIDSVPILDTNNFDPAHVKHVANCLGIDTVGLELRGVPATKAELPKKFSEQDEDGDAVPGSGWSKSSLQSSSGKRSLAVRYVDASKKLTIEGSEAMRRQEHNVVASNDLTMLAYSMVRSVHAHHRFNWSLNKRNEIAHGNVVEVTRVDPFLLLRVPDGCSKAEFINTLAIVAIRLGMDVSLYSNESVYFNQSSQLEAVKIYDKAAELRRARKAGLPEAAGVEELVSLIKNTVRLECVFRAKRLTQIAKAHGGRPHPRLFTKELLAKMILSLLQKLALDGNIFRRLGSTELAAIPLPYRSTFAHWQNGENLSEMVKSERVLKEHKAYIKAHFNINLNVPFPNRVREPIPLAEILAPENFVPVPEVIRQNPELFYEIDMAEQRHTLKRELGNGISSVVLDPFRPSDAIFKPDNGDPFAI